MNWIKLVDLPSCNNNNEIWLIWVKCDNLQNNFCKV